MVIGLGINASRRAALAKNTDFHPGTIWVSNSGMIKPLTVTYPTKFMSALAPYPITASILFDWVVTTQLGAALRILIYP